MGLITDIIKGLPLSAVQDEKIKELEKRLIQLETENKDLKNRITGCPRCRSLNWRIDSCVPDPIFGALGGNNIVWKCPDCELSMSKIE